MDKIDDLKVNKIILEYNFLKNDEELIKELIKSNEQEFLKLVNDNLEQVGEDELKPKDVGGQKQVKKIEPMIKPEDVDNNTKVKVKKIYRQIVKLTHPDKTSDIELNDLYIQSKEAYECFDLFELYFIAKTLKINFKLTLSETNILNTLTQHKKDEIKKLQSSFIWLWINANNEEEKNDLVQKFLKVHYLK
jgi:2,3-bisphosphoglycerate-independent phosphoglycerate mutase